MKRRQHTKVDVAHQIRREVTLDSLAANEAQALNAKNPDVALGAKCHKLIPTAILRANPLFLIGYLAFERTSELLYNKKGVEDDYRCTEDDGMRNLEPRGGNKRKSLLAPFPAQLSEDYVKYGLQSSLYPQIGQD